MTADADMITDDRARRQTHELQKSMKARIALLEKLVAATKRGKRRKSRKGRLQP